jgi:cytochrome P450
MAVSVRPQSPPTIPAFRLAVRPITTLPGFLLKLTRERGHVLRFSGMGRSIFVFTEPALVEEVFVTKASAFIKGRGTQRLVDLVGRGLLSADAPDHLPHRRLVQPAFHRRRIDEYGRIMVERTRAQAERWKPGQVIEVDREMNRIALEIVSKALFGRDISSEVDTVAGALDAALSTFPFRMMPFAEMLDETPVPPTQRLKHARAELDRVVYRMIAEHRAAAVDTGDLLSMLLESEDDEHPRLNDEQVRDEAMTILLAGHETTANALAWTFYLLGRNPDVEKRLQAHLDQVLGDRDPRVEDLPQLAYVRSVFAETMRLYPPAWVTSRKAIRRVEIGPYVLEPGHVAMVSQYVSHRDPRYFPDPERFDPDRWSGEPPPKFAYFPFGGGNRLCIGESFAWMEGVLAIATIARRMRLVPLDASEVGTLPLVTLRPRTPIRARIELRAPVTAT